MWGLVAAELWLVLWHEPRRGEPSWGEPSWGEPSRGGSGQAEGGARPWRGGSGRAHVGRGETDVTKRGGPGVCVWGVCVCVFRAHVSVVEVWWVGVHLLVC